MRRISQVFNEDGYRPAPLLAGTSITMLLAVMVVV